MRVWTAAPSLAAVILGTAVVSAQTPPPVLSPAQQRIGWAEAAVRKNPTHFQPYTDLAAALIQRAQDTFDPAHYDAADTALQQALRLAPDNFDASKLRVSVLLGRHEFRDALVLAKALNERLPDDVALYGLIAGAQIELGEYDAAEKSAQFMFDLRPPTASGFLRAAELRQVFGDLEGAAQFLDSAYRSTSQAETAERASILARRAELALTTGGLNLAEKYVQQALAFSPGHPTALARLADVRSAQRRFAEAVELWRQVRERVPHPRNRYALALAFARSGRAQDAADAFSVFEREALAITGRPDHANRELVAYYAGRPGRYAEAVALARLELGRRQDIRTLAAAAHALHAHGDQAEARVLIRKALSTGIRDAELFCRAGAIERALKNRHEAARYFTQAREVNRSSTCAGSARAAVASAPGGSPDAARRRDP